MLCHKNFARLISIFLPPTKSSSRLQVTVKLVIRCVSKKPSTTSFSETTMKGAKSLLTIPKQDDETYLLVELPESFPIGSLLQAGSFVGHKSSSQACLVSGDSSFSLCRVETSNALVLVPPANNSETSESQPPPNKKQMTSVSNEGGLAITPCHLLGAGSGAFFLQLKERHLHLKDLHDLLSTFDPYDPEAKFEGKSLDQLALELQVSKVQVQKGLTDLRAFEHESKYYLLSEEAWQEARRAIISALTECDDFAEFASCGLERRKLIQEGLKRLTESFLQGHGVLQLAVSSITSKEDTETIWIDFDKVNVKSTSI